MKYTLIDREKAPREVLLATTSERRRLSEDVVVSLTPGKVAEIKLGPDDTPRGVKASLTRAAKRHDREVRSWDVKGIVYAELVEGQSA